jgi:peroxiredoxin
MRHLVELQKHYGQIKSLDAEIVAVFREEKLGAEGLKRSRDNARTEFTLVNDLGAKATSAYSQGNFTSYVIDKKGVIQAVLQGTLTKRISSDDILRELKKLAESYRCNSSPNR